MEKIKKFNRGDLVVCTYGWNKVLNKPFQFLYEFGYYTDSGCVVYTKGNCNMQDSYVFTPDKVRSANKEDMRSYFYGT
jgi:hypothetical protein